MSKSAVTLEVDKETAQAYSAMSSEDRRKIQMLLGLWLRDWVRRDGPTLHEAARYAQSQGLTPEILESLLQEV